MIEGIVPQSEHARPSDRASSARPDVSVVIPTYNRLTLLREAVASVLNQVRVDFELIVADDGSTDETSAYLECLSGIRTGHSRPLQAFSIPHTGMPGAVRNVGARIASGRYLAFLDSDDLWLSDKLKRQLELHRATPRSLISHTGEHWLRTGRVVSQAWRKHRRQGLVFADAVVKCTIGPSTAMIDRELFIEHGGFREDMDYAEDYELWLRLVWNRDVAYLDEPLTVKRAGHADQLSERFGSMELIRLKALRHLVDSGTFTDSEADGIARRELARKCRIYAAGARKHRHPDDAYRHEALAEHYEPT